MPEIKLTPAHRLVWLDTGDTPERGPLAQIGGAFQANWVEGLFLLAGLKAEVAGWPTLRYWQQFADHYLTGLSHIPPSAERIEVTPPNDPELAGLVLTGPPMQGGEYLATGTLTEIWQALEGWTLSQVAGPEHLRDFLQQRAPLWRQVGRVCFHLAENKANPDYPFAFMASYSSSLGAGGRLKHLPLNKALEQYAGARNRAALLNLLTPVDEAGRQCDWVRESIGDGRIYQPQVWSPQQAYRFLKDIPLLEACGIVAQVPNWWKKRPNPTVSVTIGEKRKSAVGLDALLDFNLAVAIGDDALSPEELNELLAGTDGLVWFKNQWVEVDRERLQEALDHWESLRQMEAGDGEISFIAGMRLLAGASADLKQQNTRDQERQWAHVQAGSALRDLLEKLRDPAQLEDLTNNNPLHAILRPYQRHGVAWLYLLMQLGLGACLADDMGLGKTVQVLTLLSHFRRTQPKAARRPSLLVIPVSLLSNWRKEAARFTPDLKLVFLHPAEMDRDSWRTLEADPKKAIANADLAVTTYSMLARQEWLAQERWHLAILDEAQAIKNPSTRQSKAVRQLKAAGRIALTGTPVENRLGDLWSLFDFLNPGLLGSAKVFQGFVKALQNRAAAQYAPLRQLAGPYILRRMKTDRTIISDLPDKTELTSFCKLGKEQVKLYQAALDALRQALENASGIARRGLVLQSIMRFKQICNHPSQLTGDGDFDPAASGKFLRLGEICEEIAARQEKALIFTQFREITEPLAAHLATLFGRPGLILHGGTPARERHTLIDQFQTEEGPPFFVLSLKAGGTGLNLTAASHIIHFDRWWNPAVENQATDRAFRIGQKKNVLVHKFVTQGTIEERIDAMIQEKSQMAREVLASGGEVNLTELSNDELLNLISLDISRAQL